MADESASGGGGGVCVRCVPGLSNACKRNLRTRGSVFGVAGLHATTDEYPFAVN